MTIPKVSLVNSSGTTQIKKNHPQDSNPLDHQYYSRELYDIPSGITALKSPQGYQGIKKLSPEELFDIQFNSGTKLSNNAVLIRPVILSLGEIDIKPTKDNNKLYTFVRKPLERNLKKQTRLISEEELLQNRSLTRGAIKKVDDGLYEMVFLDKNGEKQNIVAGKEDCLNILRDNLLYM